MDVLAKSAAVVNLTLSRGYLSSTTYAPRAYHKIYQMMVVSGTFRKVSITSLVNKVLSREVQDAITVSCRCDYQHPCVTFVC
jgi:hypothetical protein